jgi:hypothetical protein
MSDPFHYGEVACEIREFRLSGNAIPTYDNLAGKTLDVHYDKPGEVPDECIFPGQVDQMGRTRRPLTSRYLPGYIRAKSLDWICQFHRCGRTPPPIRLRKTFRSYFGCPSLSRDRNPNRTDQSANLQTRTTRPTDDSDFQTIPFTSVRPQHLTDSHRSRNLQPSRPNDQRPTP